MFPCIWWWAGADTTVRSLWLWFILGWQRSPVNISGGGLPRTATLSSQKAGLSGLGPPFQQQPLHLPHRHLERRVIALPVEWFVTYMQVTPDPLVFEGKRAGLARLNIRGLEDRSLTCQWQEDFPRHFSRLSSQPQPRGMPHPYITPSPSEALTPRPAQVMSKLDCSILVTK